VDTVQNYMEKGCARDVPVDRIPGKGGSSQ